jgi:hypothetical protein
MPGIEASLSDVLDSAFSKSPLKSPPRVFSTHLMVATENNPLPISYFWFDIQVLHMGEHTAFNKQK